jgi:hypothetical protein
MPKIEDYMSSAGKPLKELFALVVMRSLTPIERQSVINHLTNQ